MTPEFNLTVTAAPIISLRKPEGSLPSVDELAPFSISGLFYARLTKAVAVFFFDWSSFVLIRNKNLVVDLEGKH